MRVLDLVALLIYTYGAFVYSAMLVVWTTSPRRGAWQSADTVGVALGALSTVWFLFHAAATVWPDGGWSPAERRLAISTSITLSCAFPPLIMHVTWVQLDGVRRAALPAVVRGLLPFMYVASVGVTAIALSAVWNRPVAPGITRNVLEFGISALFIVCGFWAAFVTVRAGRRPDHVVHARTHRVLTTLFLAMSVVFVLMLIAWQAVFIGRAVEIVVTSLPLVFLFAGTWLEDRLTFFDIFLKRGFRLLLTLVLLTACAAVVLPLVEMLGVGWWRPVAFALALLPAVMLLPRLTQFGDRWLDRVWFGRRVSASEAIEHLLDAAKGARDEDALRARVATAIAEATNLAVHIDVDVQDPASTSAHVMHDDVAGAGSPDDLTSRGGLTVDVDAGDGPAWRLRVEPKAPSSTLLSEDITRVRTLARVAAPLVRAIRVQQTVREHEGRTQQLALDARRAELRALRAQIDPHFLFNALNAVAGLVHVDAERADRAVEALADVFRYTLRASEREWARVDDELSFAQAYLDVERARFGETRLVANVRCDLEVRAALVPALVVQTLVENAIKHGVALERGPSHVDVEAWVDEGHVVITVANDGPPPPPDVLMPASASGTSDDRHGLRNIRARLAGYFGDAASLTLTRDEQTRATLRLPRVWDTSLRETTTAASALPPAATVTGSTPAGVVAPGSSSRAWTTTPETSRDTGPIGAGTRTPSA